MNVTWTEKREYSQLSLNGHLHKTDTFVGPDRTFLVGFIILELSIKRTHTSIRRTVFWASNVSVLERVDCIPERSINNVAYAWHWFEPSNMTEPLECRTNDEKNSSSHWRWNLSCYFKWPNDNVPLCLHWQLVLF